MRCEKCGSDLPEDSNFCQVCREKVGDAQGVKASYSDLPFGAIIVCPKCGAKNSRTDRWCGSCDADLEGAKKRAAAHAPSGPDCPACGVKNEAGASYCRKCGAEVVPILWDSKPAKQREIIRERQVIMIRCKYCGTLNGPSEKNCTSCGAQM